MLLRQFLRSEILKRSVGLGGLGFCVSKVILFSSFGVPGIRQLQYEKFVEKITATYELAKKELENKLNGREEEEFVFDSFSSCDSGLD